MLQGMQRASETWEKAREKERFRSRSKLIMCWVKQGRTVKKERRGHLSNAAERVCGTFDVCRRGKVRGTILT